MLKRLLEEKILVVMRGLDLKECRDLCTLLVDAGLSFAEVSFTDDGAGEILRELKQSFKEKLFIGAGTVFRERDYAGAVRSGADFVLSPGFSPEVARLSRTDNLTYIPGVYTSADIQTALGAGLDLLKLFPSEPNGLQLLKAYRGPFPQASFIPFGGVTALNAGPYIEAGAAALGVGSYIANVGLIKEGNLSEVADRIRRIKEASASGK